MGVWSSSGTLHEYITIKTRHNNHQGICCLNNIELVYNIQYFNELNKQLLIVMRFAANFGVKLSSPSDSFGSFSSIFAPSLIPSRHLRSTSSRQCRLRVITWQCCNVEPSAVFQLIISKSSLVLSKSIIFADKH